MNKLQGFMASPSGKFIGGFVSAGGAALTTFLVASGCSVTTLKEFGISAGIAILGGLFHVAKNSMQSQ